MSKEVLKLGIINLAAKQVKPSAGYATNCGCSKDLTIFL